MTGDVYWVCIGQRYFGPIDSYAEACRLTQGEAGGTVTNMVPPDGNTVSVDKLAKTNGNGLRSLETSERVIEDGIINVRENFARIGAELAYIRDHTTYQGKYHNFEDYCSIRWGFSESYASRLINGAKTIADLPIGNFAPVNEAQARELRKAEKGLQATAIELAVRTAPDGKLTAGHIQSVVTVLKEAVATGAISANDAGNAVKLADALRSPVTEETYERTRRQQAHIRQSIEKKQGHDHDDCYEQNALVISTDDRRGFVTLQFPDLCRVVGQGMTIYVIAYVSKVEGEIKPS